VVTDIKMPPTHTEEGLDAAEKIPRRHPRKRRTRGVAVPRVRLCDGLLEEFPKRVGYLLKDRVSDLAVLADALRRIAADECVIDPTIVARLVTHRRETSSLDELTEREREVLALMAEGHSNEGSSEMLVVSPKTVEGTSARS
jgi:serine/threonine-protein kinase